MLITQTCLLIILIIDTSASFLVAKTIELGTSNTKVMGSIPKELMN